MERLARVRLGGLASRVEFSITDLSRLGQIGPGGSADDRRAMGQSAPARQRGTPSVNPSPHRHDHPLPAARQHADALAAAGLTDLDMPWRASRSVFVLARRARPGSPARRGIPIYASNPSEEG
jgi:hypothetical protein